MLKIEVIVAVLLSFGKGLDVVHTGLTGPPIPEQGLPGIPGQPGHPGYPGFPGPKGERGNCDCPAGAAPLVIEGKKGDRGDPGHCVPSGVDCLGGGGPGMDGIPGMKGASGIPGYSGLPGPKGDPGFPGRPGMPGPKGASGFPGYSGLPGPKGEQGFPGLPGLPAPSGGHAFPGTSGLPVPSGNTPITSLLVRHSQSTEIPSCPSSTKEVWNGYSWIEDGEAERLGRGSFRSYDLGSIDSCPHTVNNHPSLMTCSSDGSCSVRHENTTKRYWLAAVLPESSMEETSIRDLEKATFFEMVSRCAVCEISSAVFALHSSTSVLPDCPQGWSVLWTGYSFMTIKQEKRRKIKRRTSFPLSYEDSDKDRKSSRVSSSNHVYGKRKQRSMSSTGSCLEKFVSHVVIQCDQNALCRNSTSTVSAWMASTDSLLPPSETTDQTAIDDDDDDDDDDKDNTDDKDGQDKSRHQHLHDRRRNRYERRRMRDRQRQRLHEKGHQPDTKHEGIGSYNVEENRNHASRCVVCRIDHH